jgi:intracellular septation protein A
VTALAGANAALNAAASAPHAADEELVPPRTSDDQVAAPAGSLTLPPLRQIAWRGIPQAVDAIVPLGLFLIVDALAGIVPAMLAGLAWTAFAVLRRVARSRRIPGIVVVSGCLFLLRLTLVVTTGSAFLYFLQPTIGTALVALAFLVSVVVGRPLARRFAGDFLTLPGNVVRAPHMHRFFVHNSMMWAVVGALNAGLTYLLLLTLSSSTFAITQTTLSITVTVTTVGVSILWFRRSMGRYHTIVFTS